LDEDAVEEGKKFQFKDTSRFDLANCFHFSPHLQCSLSYFVAGHGYTVCPIMDTPQCRGTKDAQGNCGKARYWAPQDYYSFAKAFFRTKALTDAFLKPEFR